MRILHLDTAQDLRGGQHQLLMLARGLRKRGHQQLIACPDASALETRARSEGFDTLGLPGQDPGHALGIMQLRQHLAAQPADILHAHDGKGHTITCFASFGMRPRPRTVASRRVTFSPARTWSTRLKYGLACDGVIAVSECIKSLLLEAGVPVKKIAVIPDGVELPSEIPGGGVRALVRAAWGFGEREFVIGHLGAFTPEKGQDIALEAMLLLAERVPQARLVLAGDFPAGATVFARAIKNRLNSAPDRVRLLGGVQDLSELFAGLDLYVMPSRAEGLGSALLIAMAHGLPVVATRVGGLPEIVEEGRTGWLVEPESPAALARAVACAASDCGRLIEFGRCARQLAVKFSSEAMVERTEGFYNRLPGGASGGG